MERFKVLEINELNVACQKLKAFRRLEYISHNMDRSLVAIVDFHTYHRKFPSHVLIIVLLLASDAIVKKYTHPAMPTAHQA